MLVSVHVVKTFLLTKNNRYIDIPTLNRVIQNTDINSEQNFNQMCCKEYLTSSCYISVYIYNMLIMNFKIIYQSNKSNVNA